MSADLTLLDARADRDELVGCTDVLDKVGVLRTLPDDIHVTTAEVANFYEVDAGTIRQVVNRNREELDDDGYTVVSRGEFEGSYNMSLPSSASTVALFPRRAVLRLGMLLRDSDVARRVRDMLLSAEAAARFAIPTSFPEALRLAADEHEARTLAEAKVAELEPKAELADNYLIAQGGARLVREVAKTFGMKEHELRTFMLDEKLIYARHSPCGEVQYDHYAGFAHYFLPREKVVQHRWGSCTHYTLMILPHGVELLSKRLRRSA
jgi:hypothetical protein